MMKNGQNTEWLQIKCVGRHFERPPRIRLYFDLELRNEEAKSRWFLLPDRLEGETGAYAIDALDVYELSGEGRVVIGHFSGMRGFHALLLPAGAEVTLRQFPVLWRGKMPTAVSFQLTTAQAVTVGDQPCEAWFPANPASDKTAGVNASPLADQSQVIFTRHTADYKEVAVSLAGEEHFIHEVVVGG